MSLPTTPISVKPSATEIRERALNQKNLEIAIRALHRDGLVVLEDLVPHPILDRLNRKMVEDAYELQSRADSPFNYHKGNIQQDPLLTKDFFFEEVFVSEYIVLCAQSVILVWILSVPRIHFIMVSICEQSSRKPHSSYLSVAPGLTFPDPIVTQVTSTALGPKPALRFISGNTALPPTAEAPPASQPTHNDADFDHPRLPFALVINVPLVGMTPENGSTEIWLGTHTDTTIADQEGAHGERASGRIKQHLLDERRKVRGPSQPVVKKGSIIVRDLRLWHGGKPNLTEEPRVMLAFST